MEAGQRWRAEVQQRGRRGNESDRPPERQAATTAGLLEPASGVGMRLLCSEVGSDRKSVPAAR
jgi:hypothetical protein